MDPQLRRRLTESAYYATAASIDSAGTITYNSPTLFLCRTELQTVYHGPMFLPRGGTDVEFMHLLFTETEIPDNARIWLPGDSISNIALAREIRRKETVRNSDGDVTHYEVYI